MARPGFLDWLCQAGRFVLKTERLPLDKKTLVSKNDAVEVNPAELITTNGGLKAGTDGKIGVDVDNSTITLKAGKLAFGNNANSPTADKWKTPRTIGLTGAVTGTATPIDGSKNVEINTTAIDMSKATGTLAAARGGTGRTDGKAAAWATARAIDGVDCDGSANIIHYGECSTAAATAAKVVPLTGFWLTKGSRICVFFTVANTANNPSLNVNNTGAKPIRYRNAAIERYYLEANRIYDFVYDGAAWQIVGDLNCPYELCELYYFRHPDLRRGFVPMNGGVIQNAATKYPLAWAYLQTAAGKKVCLTEAEWQALSTKTYYTLADGTKLGFNGIGGVPFFVVNTSAKTLRMPDIRGTFPEPAGFASLNVAGDVALDAQREVWGEWAGARTEKTVAEWGNEQMALGCASYWKTSLGGNITMMAHVTEGVAMSSPRICPNLASVLTLILKCVAVKKVCV